MGKTALVLSGGGSRGAYEIGICRALNELGKKIDMVFGTSVGSINGAMVAQSDLKLAEQLWQQLETDMVFDLNDQSESRPLQEVFAYAKEIVTNGGAGTSGLKNILSEYIDEKRVRDADMDYGLVTTEFPSMKAGYFYIKDIEEGSLVDYILASASCFPAVQKYMIKESFFIDGGYTDNMPVRMALKKSAESIIAVDLHAAGIVKKDYVEKAKEKSEFHMLESAWDLGNFLLFDKANASRIMRLGYLDGMKHWKKFEGSKYTFRCGIFTEHELKGAEEAADILKIDPLRIYERKSFKDELCINMKKYIPAARFAKNSDSKTSSSIEKLLSEYKSGNFNVKPLLLMYVEKSLCEEGAQSVFLQPKIFKMMEDVVQAANFLINFHVNPADDVPDM